jgi:hypothetical protein
MTEQEQPDVIQTADEPTQAVKVDRSELLQLKGRVSNELEYLRNKAVHLSNAMQLCTDTFDADKPENRYSLTTFCPVVAELAEELEGLRSSLWERGG